MIWRTSEFAACCSQCLVPLAGKASDCVILISFWSSAHFSTGGASASRP